MPLQVPEGRFMGLVKVGEKGQIVIPKGARDLFQIQPGDNLLLLADVKQGIALVQADAYFDFANQLTQLEKEQDNGNAES